MKRILVLCVMVLGLYGCASTNQYVPVATFDSLDTGNALIAVQRESGFMGGGVSVDVTDNGEIVGEVASGDSLTWQRAAGNMDITLAPLTLNVKDNLKPLHVKVVAGEQYNFKVFLSMEEGSFVIQREY